MKSILVTASVLAVSAGGAFAGGLLGGYFLSGGDPATVFVACALLSGIWLSFHQLVRSSE